MVLYAIMETVAIHNKNGKGLLLKYNNHPTSYWDRSQSTIKMEKGYYNRQSFSDDKSFSASQSTIKMEKGY